MFNAKCVCKFMKFRHRLSLAIDSSGGLKGRGVLAIEWDETNPGPFLVSRPFYLKGRASQMSQVELAYTIEC